MPLPTAITQDELAEKFYNQLCPELDDYETWIDIEGTLLPIIDMKIEELYEAHKKMIFSLAWKNYSAWMEFEDLVGKGNLIFVESQKAYDPEHEGGACFSTFLYSQLKFAFMNDAHEKKSTAILRVDSDVDTTNPHTVDHDRVWRLKDALEELTEDARYIVNLVLEKNPILAENYRNFSKSLIRKHLLTIWQGDYVQDRITDAFAEIKCAVNNI